jgi:hypothetical protein
MSDVSDEDVPRFEFDAEGHLTLSFGLYNEGWREAVCVECGEPIPWVLDMFSFKHNGRGGFDLGHASCLWTPEGFDRPKARSLHISRDAS